MPMLHSVMNPENFNSQYTHIYPHFVFSLNKKSLPPPPPPLFKKIEKHILKTHSRMMLLTAVFVKMTEKCPQVLLPFTPAIHVQVF